MWNAFLQTFQISLPEVKFNKSHKLVSPIVYSCLILQQLLAASESTIPNFLWILQTFVSQFFEMYLLTIYFRELLYIFFKQSFGFGFTAGFFCAGISPSLEGVISFLSQSSEKEIDDQTCEIEVKGASQLFQIEGQTSASGKSGISQQRIASIKDSISSLVGKEVINKYLENQDEPIYLILTTQYIPRYGLAYLQTLD